MKKNDSILIVKDDTDLQELICMAGNRYGYTFFTAGDGLQAKELLQQETMPNLIILDINMPGMDGLSFCRWLREDYPGIPVIFLSARSGEFDKVLALEIGGDDYLTKPFSMKELFARIAVSLRRVKMYSSNAEPSAIKHDGMLLDQDSWTCSYLGCPIQLTVSEFRILKKISEYPGMVFSRDKLAMAAFPDDSYNTGRSVDIHISRIRTKLQEVNPDFNAIQTVFKVGYKWKN